MRNTGDKWAVFSPEALMNVLTLSRQLGSGGDWIAREVARRLGFAYRDHEIVNRAARQAGVPEVALAHLDELGFLGLRPSPQDHRAYLNQVETILHELADHGNVIIVGCGAQVVLKHHPEAVHVQVVAPFELRLSRLMASEGISEDAAINRLTASDKKRANYLKDNYGVNWLDPNLYDLLINTKRIACEDAAASITALLRSANQKVLQATGRAEQEE
jgi:cytidylate kinase